MKSSERDPDYWVRYWTTNEIIGRRDPQAQVGRTVHKVPIDPGRWQFQLREIERKLDLGATDTLLDLCAGNGLITVPLALKCASATLVDVSAALLAGVDVAASPNLTLIEADVRTVDLPPGAFSRGLMYGALQYFSEREAIGLLESMHRTLSPGGIWLVGDVPDIDRLFAFYRTPVWVAAYFDSVKAGTPAVGTWFKKEVLLAMAKYVGFRHAEVLDQHPSLINGHYRFDLRLAK
jgi:ubiquinone/menaquinone biosynthesis C-methylase UbiE